jgi:hypothetical protein
LPIFVCSLLWSAWMPRRGMSERSSVCLICFEPGPGSVCMVGFAACGSGHRSRDFVDRASLPSRVTSNRLPPTTCGKYLSKMIVLTVVGFVITSSVSSLVVRFPLFTAQVDGLIVTFVKLRESLPWATSGAEHRAVYDQFGGPMPFARDSFFGDPGSRGGLAFRPAECPFAASGLCDVRGEGSRSHAGKDRHGDLRESHVNFLSIHVRGRPSSNPWSVRARPTVVHRNAVCNGPVCMFLIWGPKPTPLYWPATVQV